MIIDWDAVGAGAIETLFFFFKFGIAWSVYEFARDNNAIERATVGQLWIRALKAIGIIALIALVVCSQLGSHPENCDDDPLNGRCETVTDYRVTVEEQSKTFSSLFLFLLLPYLLGLAEHNRVTKGKKPITPAKMTVEEAIEISTTYADLQAKIMEDPKVRDKYPTLSFPESLLPYPKEKIAEALRIFIANAPSEEIKESAKSCLAILQNFFTSS